MDLSMYRREQSRQAESRTWKINVDNPKSPPLKIRTEIDANPFHTLAGAFEIEMQESEVKVGEPVSSANINEHQYDRNSPRDGANLEGEDEKYLATETQMQANRSDKSPGENQEETTRGMKWCDFLVESDDDEEPGVRASPIREAAANIQNSSNPSSEDTVRASNDDEDDRTQAEVPNAINANEERSPGQEMIERVVPRQRDELEQREEHANARVKDDEPTGEGSSELLKPAASVVVSAQKPLENLLAVSDSQLKT
ncbi:hypothetical protein R1sor_012454 [Riccia sorocarpa]|uniref:Uncharacterized protein n=1 Tax=Riccia sorocarpa TaxID=122646 RepID=A0ABD3I464_9MARC